MVEDKAAQNLHQQAALLAFFYRRAYLAHEGFCHFPALAQFGGYLVDFLLLSAQRRTGDAFHTDTAQMFKQFVQRQAAFGEDAVDLRLDLRLQAAQCGFAPHITASGRDASRREPQCGHRPRQGRAG